MKAHGFRLFALTLAMAMLAVLCFAVAGCSDSGSSGSASDAASPDGSSVVAPEFVGTWELESMEDSADEELRSMQDIGYNMFFVLSEDGKATYEFLGYAEEGTYEKTSATEATLNLEDDDNWTNTMRIEDGKLILESVDGGICAFKKITEEEHQAYNEEFDLG